MSTRTLASSYSTRNSSVIVVGVDRSEDRLSRGGMYKDGVSEGGGNVMVVSENCIMVRADVPSLISMCLNEVEDSDGVGFPGIFKTTIYYPNPYPKSRSYNSRFYGEPWFFGYRGRGGEVEVRSNWETLCLQCRDVWVWGGMGIEGVERVVKEVEEGGGGGGERGLEKWKLWRSKRGGLVCLRGSTLTWGRRVIKSRLIEEF